MSNLDSAAKNIENDHTYQWRILIFFVIQCYNPFRYKSKTYSVGVWRKVKGPEDNSIRKVSGGFLSRLTHVALFDAKIMQFSLFLGGESLNFISQEQR